jgi:hypothetical protein
MPMKTLLLVMMLMDVEDNPTLMIGRLLTDDGGGFSWRCGFVIYAEDCK